MVHENRELNAFTASVMTLRPPAGVEDELRYASVPVSAITIIKRNNKKSVFFIFPVPFEVILRENMRGYIYRVCRTDFLSV